MKSRHFYILWLTKIFREETDEEHALTLQEIAERLEAQDIGADRKTLYDDFEELRNFGLDIIAEKRGRNTYYYLGAREYLPLLLLEVVWGWLSGLAIARAAGGKKKALLFLFISASLIQRLRPL